MTGHWPFSLNTRTYPQFFINQTVLDLQYNNLLNNGFIEQRKLSDLKRKETFSATIKPTVSFSIYASHDCFTRTTVAAVKDLMPIAFM